jgi:hypothetical protein
MLVVDNQRSRKGRRGGYTLAKSKSQLRTGRGLSTVPMFFLFAQVKLRKRLSVEPVAEKWVRAVPGLLDRGFDQANAAEK